MKRAVLICVVLFAFIIENRGQNLVPNGNFEVHFDCNAGIIESSSPWCGINACGYCNTCNTNPIFTVPRQDFSPGFPTYQIPHSGNGYVEFGFMWPTMPSPSRYPHTPLKDTLEIGKTYCVTYYVSLWNDCKYSADKFGALFTSVPFNCTVGNQDLYTGYTPQVVSTPGVLYGDTLGWMEVSGTFTALGNEAYLTIGNFFPNAQHTYSISYPSGVRPLADYYLDDVSVEEVQPVICRNDTSIVLGDSAIVGANLGEANLYSWQPTAGLSCTNCPNPKASPGITTTYTVTKTQCHAITTDVITVSVTPTAINELNYNNLVKISPNPVADILNMDVREFINKENLTIKVIDVLSREILFTEYKSQLDVSSFEKGIYFISIQQGSKALVTKKIIKQ